MKSKMTLFKSFLSVLILMNFIGCKTDLKQSDQNEWLNAQQIQLKIEYNSQKVGELLDEYKNPSVVHIEDQTMYIFNDAELSLNLYSLPNFSLLQKIGKSGEGPGEFRVVQKIEVFPDEILINSPGKNSFFSYKGKLLREVKFPPHLIPCLPIGNQNFVSREYSMPGERNLSTPYSITKFVLLDKDYQLKKVLFEKKLNTSLILNSSTNERIARLFPDFCTMKTYKNKIYIGLSTMEEFSFSIFDSDGNEIKKIQKPYIKVKIPAEIKEAILNKQQKTVITNQSIKIEFYEYYPSFANFEVADDRIYVFLYPESDQNQKVIIMDLEGKLLEIKMIPFEVSLLQDFSYRILFTNKVYKGEKYFFKDNTDTGRWEIWKTKITTNF